MFRGEEPNENRLNVDRPRLDSWSVRGGWRGGPWRLQVSGARLNEPEWFEPYDVTRLTASIEFDGEIRSRPVAATLAWGENREIHGNLDGYLLEWSARAAPRDLLHGRVELAARDILTLGSLHPRGFTHPHQISRVFSLTLGYTREVHEARWGRVGLGADATGYRVSDDLRRALRPAAVLPRLRALAPRDTIDSAPPPLIPWGGERPRVPCRAVGIARRSGPRSQRCSPRTCARDCRRSPGSPDPGRVPDRPDTRRRARVPPGALTAAGPTVRATVRRRVVDALCPFRRGAPAQARPAGPADHRRARPQGGAGQRRGARRLADQQPPHAERRRGRRGGARRHPSAEQGRRALVYSSRPARIASLRGSSRGVRQPHRDRSRAPRQAQDRVRGAVEAPSGRHRRHRRGPAPRRARGRVRDHRRGGGRRDARGSRARHSGLDRRIARQHPRSRHPRGDGPRRGGRSSRRPSGGLLGRDPPGDAAGRAPGSDPAPRVRRAHGCRADDHRLPRPARGLRRRRRDRRAAGLRGRPRGGRHHLPGRLVASPRGSRPAPEDRHRGAGCGPVRFERALCGLRARHAGRRGGGALRQVQPHHARRRRRARAPRRHHHRRRCDRDAPAPRD